MAAKAGELRVRLAQPDKQQASDVLVAKHSRLRFDTWGIRAKLGDSYVTPP
ncbi:MAG: hypothetical protein ACLP5V_08175 [Candidatus Bathyarchaeia archaeon]